MNALILSGDGLIHKDIQNNIYTFTNALILSGDGLIFKDIQHKRKIPDSADDPSNFRL